MAKKKSSMDYEHFAAQVLKIRTALGMSQKAFGKKIGADQRTISKYENEGCTERPKFLEEIAKAGKMTVAELLDPTATALTAEEDQVVRALRSLDDTTKQKILHIIDYEVKNQNGYLWLGSDEQQKPSVHDGDAPYLNRKKD